MRQSALPASMLLVLVVVVVVTVTPIAAMPSDNAETRYGPGGRGVHAKQRMDYQAVMGCFFEIADLNKDGQLGVTELKLALNKWLTTSEQVMDALTPHRIIAVCDTDNSRQVSWAEAIEEPRCLTLTQTEGLAKWMCSRARHGDFAFSEYVALYDEAQRGILSGKGLKSVQSDYQALMDSQTSARRAALARRLHAPRLSSEVDALLNDLGSVTQVFAIPIAVIIIIFALVISCVA